MATYTITRAYYTPWDGDPVSESAVFVIDNKFQTHIGREEFETMTDQEVDDRLLKDCQWWDAKVNNTAKPYEPTEEFNNRIASFVGDEIIV